MNSSKRNTLIALLVATFLTAIDTTVMSTATSTIVRDLGGSELISWVFSIYLLTTAVTTPIYGKLADLFGRKPVFLFGTSLFLLGSVLCGLSGSMTQLLVFRGLQGLGAGAVQPITLTIIGDIFTKEERAKLMGLFSVIWGVAGLVGPLVGGFFVDFVSWHWIFYINLPVGLVSILLVSRFFHEQIAKKKVYIDYGGAILFSLSIGLFLYTLLASGEGNVSMSGGSYLLLAFSILLFVLFLGLEAKVREPMLPLPLFKNRMIAFAQVVSFLQAVVLIGSSAYMPIWIQNVLGHSAMFAGFAMLPTSIGWPIAASLSGRMLLKTGYRRVTVIGMTLLIVAALGLVMLTPQSPFWIIPILQTFLGAGFGFVSTALTIAVQSSVGWQQRGIATGSLQFVRTMGQTVGVALLGAWLNLYLPASQAEGLMGIFKWMMLTTAVGLVLSFFLPSQAEEVQPNQG
ncbi:MDR family MFS transporter [Brevibacillus massiliensis]|jgi:EmrB/QacA subfamily drug resistance transporter|uniref:MDR family MFS transporter n=1 Tax=Brevibacillus massiliensis TaxID=1118054 RepID=UPI0002E98D28|nr:MDR family MFS transporter [Brevibacillus massiliensis]